MLRSKKPTKKVFKCDNCGTQLPMMLRYINEKKFDNGIIATYINCPVCGVNILKQLDTAETQDIADKGVKLQLIEKKGRTLSAKQRNRLKSIEKELSNIRRELNRQYWNEIDHSLKQLEE